MSEANPTTLPDSTARSRTKPAAEKAAPSPFTDPLATEATIKLAFPIKVAGTLTAEITVRRPKLRDRLNASLNTDMTPDQQEALVIGNAAGLTLDEMEQLDLADFNRIQGIFSVFLSARPS